MGISCIVAYDYEKDTFRVFCDDNYKGFQKLIDTREMVVGFNNKKFDDPLCKAHDIIIDENKSFDLYIKAKEADGLDGDARIKGYSLNNFAKTNLGSNSLKTESGAMASVFYQRRQYGRLIDYCAQDVWILRELFDKAVMGTLISSRTNKKLRVKF